MKGEIRNNVLAAERLLATSTPVSQWRGILQIFGYKCLGEGDEQTRTKHGRFGKVAERPGNEIDLNIFDRITNEKLKEHIIRCGIEL